MLSDKNISCQNFLNVLYFMREISQTKLIFRSRLTCKQKDVDYQQQVKRTKESEVVGHLPRSLIFCQVKFSMKNFGVFVPAENISTRKKEIMVEMKLGQPTCKTKVKQVSIADFRTDVLLNQTNKNMDELLEYIRDQERLDVNTSRTSVSYQHIHNKKGYTVDNKSYTVDNKSYTVDNKSYTVHNKSSAGSRRFQSLTVWRYHVCCHTFTMDYADVCLEGDIGI